jgi:hypothetical protein
MKLKYTIEIYEPGRYSPYWLWKINDTHNSTIEGWSPNLTEVLKSIKENLNDQIRHD